MAEDRTPKKILEHRMIGKRRKGRPRIRRMDQVSRDVVRLGAAQKWMETISGGGPGPH